MRCSLPLADVAQEIRRGGGPWRLGVGPADVNSGVVVGATRPRSAVRLDVDRGGHVELARAGAVARLPDGEERGEALAVGRRQRRLDGIERMRQRTRDPVGVQVGRALLDVGVVRLEELVVVRGDAEAEHVNRLRLAAKPRRQLDRDEHVGAIGDLQAAVDRGVIGDRDEVHAAPLGELMDLLRMRRALGQAEVPLDTELREPRSGGVAMQVHPGGGVRAHR